jgi:hypothetical protein
MHQRTGFVEMTPGQSSQRRRRRRRRRRRSFA